MRCIDKTSLAGCIVGFDVASGNNLLYNAPAFGTLNATRSREIYPAGKTITWSLNVDLGTCYRGEKN